MVDSVADLDPVAAAKNCRRSIAVLVFCAGLAATTLVPGDDVKEKPTLPDAVPEEVDFAKDIAPLLENRCLQCHGAEKQKSGLRLDSREAALKGGNAGEVIQPRNSAESRLVLVLMGLDDDEVVMPPQGERLAPK